MPLSFFCATSSASHIIQFAQLFELKIFMSSYRDFEVAKFKVVKVPCISHIKTSQYVPTFPMTSLDFWIWDFGSHVYNILGCPELFQDLFGFLDLGLW